LKSLTYGVDFKMTYFQPIKKRSTIMFLNESRALIAKNIFQNEMYRIGGSRLLRGFDEESIFTPFYSLTTVEYRFLLSKNSYFNTFFDFAVVEDSRINSSGVDLPLGFGVGLALETKGGIFSLSYALGKQLDNSIEIRNGKIHFGYITLF
jgi:outer membrane protein assembly factor BamA